ncbi:MAG: 3-oxoacyl-ACP synthase III family protein [Polyangiales bacterium]
MNVRARQSRNYGSEIVSTGFAYPSDLIDNDEFFARCRFPLGDRDSLVRETQMRTRWWCRPEENTWTLARKAVAMALQGAPALMAEIDLVMVTSGTTMPVLHPPDRDNAGVADLAPLILRELGRDDAIGLDLKACYCTGFLRAVQVADAMLMTGNHRAALIVSTEQGSRFAVAETNRSSFCFLMSDAAGAVVLKPREGERVGIVDSFGRTEASKMDWVGIGPDAASTIMRGARAGEATVAMMIECAQVLLERNGLTLRDLDWFLPLQTHARVVESVRRAIDCPKEKLLWAGDRTGLSGSASIPAALAENLAQGTIAKGDLVLSVAVGAGMNCAGAIYHA